MGKKTRTFSDIPSSTDIILKRKEVIREMVQQRLDTAIDESADCAHISNHEEWLLLELEERGYTVETQKFGAKIWLGQQPTTESWSEAIIQGAFIALALYGLYRAFIALFAY
jgi:hypothetical protein